MIITLYEYLVNPAIVKQLTSIENEVDPLVIQPCIELGFRIYIEPAYSDEVWQDLQKKIEASQDNANPTPLDEIYQEMVDRLKLPLSLYTQALTIKPSALKNTAAGIVKRNPENTDTASFKEVSDFSASEFTQANTLWQNVKLWIDKVFIPHQEKTVGNASNLDCQEKTGGKTIGGFHFLGTKKNNCSYE